MIGVALYARAWVEIGAGQQRTGKQDVALYARAGVEIIQKQVVCINNNGRPLREGVGRNCCSYNPHVGFKVALYARAWVEILREVARLADRISRPLREGVGRNGIRRIWEEAGLCRPLREGVGRNSVRSDKICQEIVALYARAWVEIWDPGDAGGHGASPSTRGRG